jgi:hypothetical protein
VYRPFFFAESTVTGIYSLDIVQKWLIPQVEDDGDDCIYQQDGAPPHYHNFVCGCLIQHLHQCWIICMSTRDQVLLRWPPSLPNLMWCSFFLWGYVKDCVFLLLLPQDMPELWRWIITAVSETHCDVLWRVWAEMDYWLDICLVTRALIGYAKKTWRVSLSICRLDATSLFATQVHRFYELCQGITNNSMLWMWS